MLLYAYRALFRKCGTSVFFDPLSSYITYEYTSLGKHVFIGARAWFSSGEDAQINIGSFVMFGPNVTLLCGDHEIDNFGIPMALTNEKQRNKNRSSGITICDDVWIGANVTILKGVTIGRGAVVAAGSIVTRSMPPFHVCSGVPAQPRRARFPPDSLEEHIRLTDSAMANWK